ncbi:MAG TPA: hypothetical protein VKA46_12730 [Gemmataceae bacterium]|nr:hypothetical protein [Gemmataceae bacterium]
MDGSVVGLFGAVGTVALFAFLAFAVWIDYQKKKDERGSALQERMKALEYGHPPLDAEIARARAYASAAWAAGLIGLLVPIVIVSLAVAGTIVAVLYHHEGESIGGALIVAWSIAGVMVLVPIVLSLNVIRRLPRPTGEAPPPRASAREKRTDSTSAEFQEKRLEL